MRKSHGENYFKNLNLEQIVQYHNCTCIFCSYKIWYFKWQVTRLRSVNTEWQTQTENRFFKIEQCANFSLVPILVFFPGPSRQFRIIAQSV